MSAYFPLTQPAFKSSQTSVASFAAGWEIFVRPRGGSEGEEVTVYSEGQDGAATLSQPLITGPAGHIGTGEEFAWVKDSDLPVDLWGRPRSTDAEWQVLPEGDAAVVAGGMAVAVVKEAPLNVEYAEYGADGSGVADSTAAFEKALTALPARGGEIFVPGRYKLSGQLNLDGKKGIRFVGTSGLGSGSTRPSELLFTQGGASAAISARSTSGVGFQDLAIFHSNSGLTGPLIDYSHNGEAGADSAYGVLQRCHLAGVGGIHSASGLKLDKAIIMAFRDCRFTGLTTAVRGQETSGYSNEIRFDGCTFAELLTMGLMNPGECWDVIGCTFEALISGAAGGISYEGSIAAKTLNVIGCWMGDVTAGKGVWVSFNGNGLNVNGNLIGGGGEETTGVSASATSAGITIQGNRFDSTKKAIVLAAGAKNYAIGANQFNGVTTKVSPDGGTSDLGEGFVADGGKVVTSERSAWAPTKSYETFSRASALGSELVNNELLVSGQLWLAGGAVIPAGKTIKSVSWITGEKALAGGENQWFALYRQSDLALLGVTSDDTSTAWGATTKKTLNLSTPYTARVDTPVYIGIMVKATTMPSVWTAGVPTAAALIRSAAPVIAGASTGSLTNPASAPSTAGAITSARNVPYAYCTAE